MEPATATTETMQAELQRLDLQFSLEEKRAALAALKCESSVLREAWGDVVSYQDYIDGFGWSGYGMPQYQGPPATVDDKAEGRNRPVFETEQELAGIRRRARWISNIDAIACGLIETLTNYTVGKGATYIAKARPHREVSKPVLDAIQDIIDETIENNRFCNDLDRELVQRAEVDGEYFLGVFEHDARAILRTIEPEQITEPQSPRPIEDHLGCDHFASCWKFGVHTPASDVQMPLGYYVNWSNSGSDWDYIAAHDLLHVKRNVWRNVKRGLSSFHAVDRWLDRSAKLLKNTAEGAAIQSAIAYIRETAAGVTGAQASTLATQRRDATHKTPRSPSGFRETAVTRIEGPSVVTVPAGQQYKSGPLGSERAPNFMAVVQGVLRFAGARWSMPEFMISGDASNANYASTLVAESPFVKATESRQAAHLECHVRMFWRAVEIAKRRFPVIAAVPLQTLKRLVEIWPEAPAIATRDPEKETNRNKSLVDGGIMARKTWAAREGLDLEQEIKSGAKSQDCQCGPGLGGQPFDPQLPMREAFCPTGEGGGIDNSCGSGEGGGPASELASKIRKNRWPKKKQQIEAEKAGIDYAELKKEIARQEAEQNPRSANPKLSQDEKEQAARERAAAKQREDEQIRAAEKEQQAQLSRIAKHSQSLAREVDGMGMLKDRTPAQVKAYADAAISWESAEPEREAIRYAVSEFEKQGVKLSQRGNNFSWYGTTGDGLSVRVADHLGFDPHDVEIIYDAEKPPTRKQAAAQLAAAIEDAGIAGRVPESAVRAWKEYP